MMSHCPRGSLRCPVHHVFSDAGLRKSQSLGWSWIAHAATSVALCKLVSLSPPMSSHIDMNMIPSSKDSGICPFRRLRFCFLISRAEGPGLTCQMNCTSGAPKFHVSANPRALHTSSNCVTHLLGGSGFETPTHNVGPENTRTFILISFAAGSLSNVILDQRKVFPAIPAHCMHLCVRSVFALVAALTESNLCVLGRLLFCCLAQSMQTPLCGGKQCLTMEATDTCSTSARSSLLTSRDSDEYDEHNVWNTMLNLSGQEHVGTAMESHLDEAVLGRKCAVLSLRTRLVM